MIHVLRDDPAFVKELDFVMEQNGRLIGQNMFMKTVIEADDGRDISVLTMGPIGITPPLKRKGYGKILLDYSLEKAAELGFGAVLFEGNIQTPQGYYVDDADVEEFDRAFPHKVKLKLPGQLFE